MHTQGWSKHHHDLKDGVAARDARIQKLESDKRRLKQDVGLRQRNEWRLEEDVRHLEDDVCRSEEHARLWRLDFNEADDGRRDAEDRVRRLERRLRDLGDDPHESRPPRRLTRH